MTERFLILGRAGSGKTAYVLKEFYRYIKNADTEKAIFLLPTHSQTEHLKDIIIRNGPARGFVDNSIFTFSQLSREILGDDKKFHGRIASELEKDALLKDILEENPPQYLTKNSWDHRGLRHALLRFFKELKEDSLYPADFKARVDTFLSGARRNSPAARAKYEALAGVYGRFQSALEAKGLCDEDDVLNAALKRLEGDGSVMREKEVLIADGFHSFTPVEFRLLGLLAQRVPNIYITLVFDPEAKDSGSSIFDSCREVYGQLGAMGFKEVVLTCSERFASSKTLA
ncbi:MAG: UvrD-helicase domain-containing protein, partial [Candidatus Brocadiales bacterium]